MAMKIKESLRYLETLLSNDAVMLNIKNWYSHYLYGSKPEGIAKQSKKGIVYNPPGH